MLIRSISRALAAPTAIWAAPRATQWPSARQQTSRSAADSSFESSSSSRRDLGKRRGSRITAAATTGPASGPRPASSTPQTIPLQRRSKLKSGIAPPPPRLVPCADASGQAAPRRGGARARARYVKGMVCLGRKWRGPAAPVGCAVCRLPGFGGVSVGNRTGARLRPVRRPRGHRPVRNPGRQALGRRDGARLRPRRAGDAGATGRTNSQGKFVFEADRDGMWTAEAHTAAEVARVMIRVGGPAPSSSSGPGCRYSS